VLGEVTTFSIGDGLTFGRISTCPDGYTAFGGNVFIENFTCHIASSRQSGNHTFDDSWNVTGYCPPGSGGSLVNRVQAICLRSG
jgi:hypothetical protein